MKDAILATPGEPLLESIVSDRIPARSRIEVYRNHFRVSLKDGVAGSFPATRLLLGERCFDGLAGLFVRARPPEDPCLANYGGNFPEFLRGLDRPQLPPFVPEVAEFEWALVEVRNAPTVAGVSRAAYQRAIARFGGAFGIRLVPASVVRHYRWPVHRIRDATLAGEPLQVLSALVAGGHFSALLLHRDEQGDPCRLPLDRACDRMLRCLRKGGMVSDCAREAHAVDRAYPFADFLVFLVESGLVAGIVPLSSVFAVDERAI